MMSEQIDLTNVLANATMEDIFDMVADRSRPYFPILI